ncbi:hypothetical protein GQ53DRAFT_816686 [Thozetella sp. PMI_491]|nr:hypothetical protein GQ53DRAFT_816686 [Thozetella sp. PMI_491]
MSAPGPESIPTSSDRRSKRPTKKRALTPVSSQAASVDALFAKPEQEIRIPTGPVAKRLAPPPEIVTNVQGSSAGAGSGEFHVYKASRRREYERLRLMDEETRKEQATAEFELTKQEREAKDDEKTRKNREKREKKMKARMKAKAGKSDTTGGDAPPPQDGQELEADGGAKAADNKTSAETSQPQVAPVVGLVIHDDD